MGSKRFGLLSWLVVLCALGWAVLPKPSSDTSLEALQAHIYLVGHLLGWLPKPREPRIDQRNPRPANTSIQVPEVQGFVDLETFKAKYQWQGPRVFRGAATKSNGFDLECLTGTGQSIKETMAKLMGDTRIRVFKDSYDDGSASHMTIEEYERLARAAEAAEAANGSAAFPYPRAFPQAALGRGCSPIPGKKLIDYHSYFLSHPSLGNELIFYSTNKATTTKMHMDVTDSFFTQVVGRKKWYFVDSNYATRMQIYGNNLNMVFVSGFDVHREPVPPEVPIRELILYPGDLVYFPPMTLHAVENLDDVTLGIDQACFDGAGALRNHWLCALFTMFNPFMIAKALKQLWRKGWIDGHEMYFDGDGFSKNVKPNQS